ncbi:MAG: hypothetical protein EXQ94_12195 [Alphaproteobacteria bacterium]|nr:hypothetical protein [Alphaproteobacteria bacterium]
MSGILTGIGHAPLLPWAWIAGLAAASLAAMGYAGLRRARGLVWRGMFLAVLLLVLLNPSLVREERQGLPDVVVLIDDQSPSQAIGTRRELAAGAISALESQLDTIPDLEVRIAVVRGGITSATAEDPGTAAFATLARELADVPADAIAGVIMVTDGQVHDTPEDAAKLGFQAPVHVLLTGAPGEIDRRLVIEDAPAYGLVDTEMQVAIRIEDVGGNETGAPVKVEVRKDDGAPAVELLPAGQRSFIRVTLDHAGTTVLQIAVEPLANELALANNQAVIALNGVRERLRVLLVSGEAHTGERVWRSLLKADPSVDLVHFTILRPPEKQDGTPIRELALISFPVRELFEIKLNEFDLIIFDRYRRRGIIPQTYFQNIADYVKQGGALFIATGPEFATPLSLFRTPLGLVMPGVPSGEVFTEGFRPEITALGRRHPVTADLAGASPDAPRWGRWFRQIGVESIEGSVLLSGVQDQPLLMLDHVGNGRVAELLSDHAWLWARGFEGGGPQAELLRRTAHWLMEEPDLEEDALRAVAQGDQLLIRRQSLEPETTPVTVTTPSGQTRGVTLVDDGRGLAEGALAIDEAGLYRLTDGIRAALAVVGDLNPKEWTDPRATAAVLEPIANATGGGIAWLAESGVPSLRRVEAERDRHGQGWLGLVRNRRFLVTGIAQFPLLPAGIALLLALGGLALAWRAEGR